ADPGRGCPGEPGPNVTVVATPPDLIAGRMYAARSTGARYFAVADSDGMQLVDDRGQHWPPDVVVRQWGPLDQLGAEDPAGTFYESERDSDATGVIQAVPRGVDGFAVTGRPVSPAAAGTWRRP
ncbi:hypothetical protein ACGFKZ_30095, partial [Micromonospora tulbaghiae]|uniref:hypothetical protein n=1 Tax=Micromonospora tulbaghiae TaxID=479978 RepID=UPI00371B6DC9